MSISEQIKELREVAEMYEGLDGGKILSEAADTIESLSAKLADMERSAEDCGKELADAKEVIRKLLCSEYDSSCQFCIHDDNEDAMCCNVGGSGSWCCENSAWNNKTE